MARKVTEVAQSTLDMVSTAVDYPLCKYALTTHSPTHPLIISSAAYRTLKARAHKVGHYTLGLHHPATQQTCLVHKCDSVGKISA